MSACPPRRHARPKPLCCLIPPLLDDRLSCTRSDFLSDYNIHLLTSHQPKPLLHEARGWAPDVHFLTGLRHLRPSLGKSISNMEESVTLDNGGFAALELNSRHLNVKNTFSKKNGAR